jgi:hypothetical protein
MTLHVAPDPADPRLTRRVSGRDHTGASIEASVTVERPLTLYLNGAEIVTMMTILDRPEDLAVGYLLNQGMLRAEDAIEDVQYDDDLGVVVVRTPVRTDFEEKLSKKTLTSGCAQGTAFGDLMEGFAEIRLDPDARLSTGGLYRLLHRINTIPSLYLEGRRHPRLRAGRGRAPALLHGGCRPPQRGGQDRRLDAPRAGARQRLLHHRAPHLGDGDQDGAHGHPILVSPLGLHRLGRRAGARGQADPCRSLQGPALHRARGRGAAGLGCRARLRRGGKRQALAQDQP